MTKEDIKRIEYLWEIKKQLHGEPTLWEIAEYLILIRKLLINIDDKPIEKK